MATPENETQIQVNLWHTRQVAAQHKDALKRVTPVQLPGMVIAGQLRLSCAAVTARNFGYW